MPGRARNDAGGEDDLVITARNQVVHADPAVQVQLDAGALQLVAEVAQGLVELFLAGNPLGHVELPADLAGGVEQADPVPTLGGHGGGGQAAGPAPTTAIFGLAVGM